MAVTTLHSRLPATARFLPEPFICSSLDELSAQVRADVRLLELYPFLPELVEVEVLRDQLHRNFPSLPAASQCWQVRPGVELLEIRWSGIPELLNGIAVVPERRDSLILLIPQSSGARPEVVTADSQSLLALKIVTEGLGLPALAQEVGVSVGYLQNILDMAVAKRLLQKPATKIVRPPQFCAGSAGYEPFLGSDVFTLQWHITQTCDLHCRHCYDRTVREEVTLGDGERILDQLYAFCQKHNVAGQVSFTGGNPLLHPHFFALYRAAGERGFMTAVLGNPAPRHQIERLVTMQMPEFFQVSLEGLSKHNDYMRGEDHFARVIGFLQILKECGVYSMVMLTLTRANQEQVLPLAEYLRDKTDLFTFNRLAMVGDGAALASAEREGYGKFLESYSRAAEKNPVMRLKDNLFNILRFQKSLPLLGGCTGYGCGAAFNFLSLLPDGQVHACRKFPSLLGNIKERSLDTIYTNDLAKRYRTGASGCRTCAIRPVCGGCLAVTHGFARDSLVDRDPYCFL